MIRLMEERDIPQVAELERLCFSTPWSENSLKESLVRPEYLFLVEETDGKVTAYGGLLQVMEEGDVTNIAVHPQHRLKGSGTRVTEALLEEGRKRGMTTFTLEVRVSNRQLSTFMKNWGSFGGNAGKGSTTRRRKMPWSCGSNLLFPGNKSLFIMKAYRRRGGTSYA